MKALRIRRVAAALGRRLVLEQTGDFTDPGDFAAWRASLGLSLAQAARALGLSRRMIAY